MKNNSIWLVVAMIALIGYFVATKQEYKYHVTYIHRVDKLDTIVYSILSSHKMNTSESGQLITIEGCIPLNRHEYTRLKMAEVKIQSCH